MILNVFTENEIQCNNNYSKSNNHHTPYTGTVSVYHKLGIDFVRIYYATPVIGNLRATFKMILTRMSMI